MTKKTKITPAMIEGLKAGGKLADLITPGLTIELTSTGKRQWRYMRRMPGDAATTVRLSGGTYPATTIAAAREWATALNLKVEAGDDPRDTRDRMTVAEAHAHYMEAVLAGRGSRQQRVLKPRTIRDKQDIWRTDIGPALGKRIIHTVSEADLIALVKKKRATAPIRANRLIAELKVLWWWCGSIEADDVVGLKVDPTRRLEQLSSPQGKCTRKLSNDEIRLFMEALVPEARVVRRGFMVMLLTACRIGNVSRARMDAIGSDGLWTIEADDHKNGEEVRIPLSPWARALMTGDGGDWCFAAKRVEGDKGSAWYKARDRVLQRMQDASDKPVKHWTPHDLRRTVRSNTRRLKIDHLTAEAMLGHKLPAGVERIYDQHDPVDDLRAAYLAWQNDLAKIAMAAGLAEVLELPLPSIPEPEPLALAA